MVNITFATLRLGKTSVDDIKQINAKAGGAATQPFQISVVCTQIPTELSAGVIVFIWLGSDNSKGAATEWKQGFKAIGRVTNVVRGASYNDDSTTDVEVFYIFPNAVSKSDLLRDAPSEYYRCSTMPIIGLDDHSNQTIRMLDSGELSDSTAFFSALSNVHKSFKDELTTVAPEFAVMFQGHASISESDQEVAFKSWLAGLVRDNGNQYSANTRNQYISAIKAVPGQFGDEIAPYSSIFSLHNVDDLDAVVARIKDSPMYEDFNRSRGNGALSACLDLYRRFVVERGAATEPSYLSPAWFKAQAANYPEVEAEADALYQQFQSMYSPEVLRSLSDTDLLGYLFLGKNDTSLCNALEFDSQYNRFGSVAGGTSYKYSLFYSKGEQTWKTSYGDGGQRSVSEEEALDIGKQIRDALVAGADIIGNCDSLSTPQDYSNLLTKLNEALPQFITRMWVLKYYHMIFPHLLPTFFGETWHKHILCNLNIIPSDSPFVRMGQINCFTRLCGISSIVFAKIVGDTLGTPKTFFRVGTGEHGEYFADWPRGNYAAIGWNELGDLTAYYQDEAESKHQIIEALKECYNYNNSLASKKAGEIGNFYAAIADTTYVVAMVGQRILGVGLLTGGYYFDESKDYGHCRPVQWLKLINSETKLPKDEAMRTTFKEIRDAENVCFLYSLLRGDEDGAIGEEMPIVEEKKPTRFVTGLKNSSPRNRILFGAPGTGKSYTLNREKDELLSEGGEYERVTFHPDYSYASFVGTYKPIPCKDSDGKDAITYAYVPGPFMRVYVKSLLNSQSDAPKPFLLVIEEINRANVAAVFGDVFQLLDRCDDNSSEYPIQASEDVKKYLASKLGGAPEEYSEIRIPDNMFIWATMNSADQGVFPMDTAFKRRWDFTYLGIDDSEAGIVGKKVVLGTGEYQRIVEWNALRRAINNELLAYKVNEDKLMGPYFIAKKDLPDSDTIDPVAFARIFKNKVIMYLFDDAAKQKRLTLFGGCDERTKNQYSKICREFDTKGVYIFCDAISSQFIDAIPEVETVEETEAEPEDDGE